ncbi:MAG TPA: 6-phosphogluconolactonase [Alphaproteobacteria bacterium]|nr:6-phosphogluconolactonase [Alphaproteobacteria bacterium]
MSARWLKFVKGHAAWAEAAAQQIARSLREAIERRGKATLVLAGGNTPREAYLRLADEKFRQEVAWEKVVCLWGDERCVPPDHPDSNFHLADTTLLSRLPTPPQIRRIHGELGAEDAASRYEGDLRSLMRQARPAFDLVLLGLGGDGHTASLFPDDPALDEKERLAVAVRGSPAHLHDRVTLTLRAINAARKVLFLVAGDGKAEILARLFEIGIEDGTSALPASLVRPRSGQVLWLADDLAAAKILESAASSSS